MFFLLSTVTAVFASDQLTKWLAIEFLKPRLSVELIPQVFHLSYVENTGIAFGFFDAHPGWLTIIISISVVCLIAYLPFFAQKSLSKRLAYGFILGGALGNLVDRFQYHHVIDFLDFRIWPVFNLADSFITVGVVCFIWFAVKKD